MKRPLCFISVIITAIVFLYLKVYLVNDLDCFPDSLNGTTKELVGMVAEKGSHISFAGEQILVITLIPREKLNRGYRYIQCYMKPDIIYEPAIGETVRLKGKVKLFSPARNPGEFDFRLYYSTLKIAYRIDDAQVLSHGGRMNYVNEHLYRLKTRLEAVLNACLNEEDSSVMKAVLLGDKAFMSQELKDLYKNSGIIHILAVSGVHISILGMGLNRLLRRMRLKVLPAAILSAGFMILYGQMCGMSSSAFRAIVMFLLRLMAPLLGRTYDLLSALSLVEILLLLDQPLYLYNSGFLFSFGAVVGIGFVRPCFDFADRIMKKGRLSFADDEAPGPGARMTTALLSGLITGFSVLSVTLPVYLCFYHTYPLYSMLLNLVVLPLMPVLMITGIVCLLLGSIYVGLGAVPGYLIHIILCTYRVLCRISTAFPKSTLFIGHAPEWKVVLYLVLLGILIKLFGRRLFMGYGARYGMAFLLMALLLFNPGPSLSISMIDVGQGDGILISCRGQNVMIDGGSTSKKEVGRYSIIPYLAYEGVDCIDTAIVTHEDEDHISGLFEIMDDMEKGGIRIKNLILPDVAEECRGDNYKKLQQRAALLGIPVTYISCGQGFRLAGELEFTCLNPKRGQVYDGANAYSTVLYMKFGDFTALFTGDVEKEGQSHILSDLQRNERLFSGITLLKVAHHGSEYTTDEEFLEILRPRLSVISCGVDNRYGHPHRALLERLEAAGTEVLRTDESGEITIEVYRDKLRVLEYLKEDKSVLTYSME